MSNKRIQKRLEEIFDEIKQPKGTSPGKKETVENRPRPPRDAGETKSTPRTGRLLTDRSPVHATNLADESIGTTTLALPFRMDPDTWAALEILAPESKKGWSQNEQLLVK